MSRLFIFIVVLGVALALAQNSAWASVPYPPNCTVEWRDLVCGGTKVFVCPSGDGSWLHVIVRDQFNQTMIGVLVTATFNASCNMYLCSPVQGTTDTNGEVNLAIRAGLDVSGGPACCGVMTTVRGMNVTLYSDSRDWLSPDLNGDGGVGEPDRAIFLADWPSSACRSDFDCDGQVGGYDYDIFLEHLGHSCQPTAVERVTWGAIKAVYR
jgi:hypothetical protein